ncbi:MAG: ATP-binding cassette domain-containing protein [Deltaproteobacteria bacterium]|nr:ATP-binding cassette domain-containing protein [Deltaproteobacteria bacterium]
MLTIEDLQVKIGDQVILSHIDLELKPGETHVLFGPNGSGKTSLLMTIMGYPGYKVTHGKIAFKGQDITHTPIHERAGLGIGMAYQRPPSIAGLKTRQMVQICAQAKGGRKVDPEVLAREVKFERFLDRDINVGFSGGEIKRSELLQLMAQDADLMMFDEPESGVDLENITLVGETIAKLLQRGAPRAKKSENEPTVKERLINRTKMGLIISHTGFILDYLTVDKAQVLYNGVLSCKNNPGEILKCIGEFGYEECVKCLM